MRVCDVYVYVYQGFIWANSLGGGGGGGNRGGRAGVKQELCVFNCLILSVNYWGGNRTSCGGNAPCWPLCR